jgi:hypothetical protein
LRWSTTAAHGFLLALPAGSATVLGSAAEQTEQKTFSCKGAVSRWSRCPIRRRRENLMGYIQAVLRWITWKLQIALDQVKKTLEIVSKTTRVVAQPRSSE